MSRQEEIQELRRLRREVADQSEERELLKKIDNAEATLNIDAKGGRDTPEDVLQVLFADTDNRITRIKRKKEKINRKRIERRRDRPRRN